VIPRSKRIFDVVAASVGLVAFAPVLTVAAVAIGAEDGGSPLFVQERLGEDLRPFSIYKLRTMRAGQVTRVGRWLRRTGIDEVPQFVNVLRGDMSVVGPRPLTAFDLRRLGWHQDRVRASVRPGITGPAQLAAGAGAAASLAADHAYAAEASLGADARFVAWSLAVNVLGKRRVKRIRAGLISRRVARRSETGARGAA
jgi:lipopolysaccharide/colanic/teichoic acid biosynthesis glycosyltransferase